MTAPRERSFAGAVLAALLLAPPRPTTAQDDASFALLQREVGSDWVSSVQVGRWATGDGAGDAADQALDAAEAEGARAARQVRAQGGRVVWIATRLLPLQSGDLELGDRPADGVMARRERRRARVDLLIRGAAPTDATPLSPRATLVLSLRATPGTPPENGPAGTLARRALTLDELARLLDDPAAFRRTAAGALLARTWARLAEGLGPEDELEARGTVQAGALRARGGALLDLADRDLPKEALGLALGRRLPLRQRLVGGDPLPTLTPEQAGVLELGLRTPPGDDAGWRRLLALRAADPTRCDAAAWASLRAASAPPGLGGLVGALGDGSPDR